MRTDEFANPWAILAIPAVAIIVFIVGFVISHAKRRLRAGDRVRHIQTGRQGIVTGYWADGSFWISYDPDATVGLAPQVLLEKIMERDAPE